MKTANLKEVQFEADIEKSLLTEGGYTKGSMEGYDYEFALNGKELVAFLEETQPEEWARYKNAHPTNTEYQIMKRVDQVIRQQGLIYVLREGIKDVHGRFKLCYFEPESTLNKDAQEQYKANRLSVIRQFTYSKDRENAIDMVLMLNGIPLVALELKDNLSHQDVNDAILQWQYDRDPREKVFRDRLFVYFAADLNEIYMTTRLDGAETNFLPYNQGSNGPGEPGGAGNPNTKDGYITAYLWEKVLVKHNLLLIIQRFLHQKNNDTLIFPRYHQWDVVNKLVQSTKAFGSGQRHLVQHSAGSGKSYSIAWLAYQLSNLHNADNQAIFDSVVVVTDRVNLDRQLQNTINSLDHQRGLVEAIDDTKSSKALAQAIEDNKRIIITTIQKFSFITEDLANQSNKSFAILIDEAHQGQSGQNAQKMTEALGDKPMNLKDEAELSAQIENQEVDGEDLIARELASHGQHENLSYYAFTATPKRKSLELFGTRVAGADHEYKPFHVYSMKQAIEEGFILDVLQNYTTYDAVYQIAQSAPDDNPELPQSKALKTINRFASLHETNISQKTAIMIETFMSVTRHKIGGRGKAMLVTSSRRHAVRYHQAFKDYIRKNQLEKELDVLVAFSGIVNDEGVEYKESQVNNMKEGELPDKFHGPDYNVLVVAEKYQTGYDEPLLHTMFVDKQLHGVKAVQTLSRINRTHEGKTDTFVLDFANDVEDIKEAFAPYYEATLLDEGVDYNMVYDIQNKLHQHNVYRNESVDQFMKLYKEGDDEESAIAELYNDVLIPVVDNYRELSTEDMYAFRTDARKLVKWYRYISQIIAFNDPELHKESIFLSYLDRVLPEDQDTSNVDLKGKLTLQYYKLQKTFEGSGSLEQAEPEESVLVNPKDVSGFTMTEEEHIRLSEIIETINKYYSGSLTEEDMKIIADLSKKARQDDALKEDASSNDRAIYKESYFPNFFSNTIAQGYKNSNDAYMKLFKDQEYSEGLMKALAELTYRWFNQREKNA